MSCVCARVCVAQPKVDLHFCRCSRHSGRYTVADTQWRIHSGRYTAAPNQDTQWWTHSRSLGDLPDIVTSPPCSMFRILGAAKPPPMLVSVMQVTQAAMQQFQYHAFQLTCEARIDFIISLPQYLITKL